MMSQDFWNKYIDLELYTKTKVPIASISCPKFGQKPDIELNAEITAADTLAAFNVTARSLYLKGGVGEEVAEVWVKAGYRGGASSEFVGSVSELYQSEPGPDSAIVIQTNQGNIETWTAKGVSVSVDKGGSLSDAVKSISNALRLDEPKIDKKSGSQKLAAGFSANCGAREAVQKLRRFFPETSILISGSRLVVQPAVKGDEGAPIELKYLSAPPQLLGGKNGTSAVITAPWNPQVKAGSIVSFPTEFYSSTGLVRSAADNTKIEVNFISLHFSTVKNINKMVVRGTVV